MKCVSRGIVDVQTSVANLNQRPKRGPGSASTSLGSNGSEKLPKGEYSAAEAARRLANIKLRQAELDYQVRARELFPKHIISAAIHVILRPVRDAMLDLPSRISPRACVLRDVTVHQAFMDAEIRKILIELCEVSESEIAALQLVEDVADKEQRENG